MFAYLIDAFTNNRYEGNPAGVVLDADSLPEEEKQKIASEIHASETAFVSKSKIADYKVEFFTPTTQIDFCGHNTIATFWLLAETGRLKVQGDGTCKITQETKAGVFPVSVSRKSDRFFVTMKQRLPKIAPPPVDASVIARSLNIGENLLDLTYPIKIANTANWHLIVAVKSVEILNSIQYDAEALSDILRKCDAVTAHAFCQSQDGTYHCRNFGPTVGIPEDPATGSAAGAFGAYLADQGFLTDGSNDIFIKQGEAMHRPGDINVQVLLHNNSVTEVAVSGTAVLSFQLSSEMTAPVLA